MNTKTNKTNNQINNWMKKRQLSKTAHEKQKTSNIYIYIYIIKSKTQKQTSLK